MFYDPQCKPETKIETNQKPSLTGLIAWLETQNPKTKYEYENCRGDCLIGQYFSAIGIEWQASAYVSFLPGHRAEIAGERPQTFGAALQRARKLQSRSS